MARLSTAFWLECLANAYVLVIREIDITSPLTIVKNFLRRQSLKGKRLCIALSGGMDSIVLLDTVDQLKVALRLDVHAIHVHHGLSPHADSWAAFCAQVCDTRNIALMTTKVCVDRQSGVGLEGAARDARYAAFADAGSPFILLAQHADDQA